MKDHTPAAGSNPFPGLRAFEEEEEHLFFGREAQVDDLLAKLSGYHFLAVIGSSGSGKSSLVKSGMLPALHRGFMAGAGSHWRIAVMRPGSDPLGNLAAALSSAGALFDEADRDGSRNVIVETVLRRSSRGLADAAREFGDRKNNLLVVVDQFEEIFRYSRYEKESQKRDHDTPAFIELLLEAAAQADAQVYVLITMRSDFLSNCTEFRGLPEAINKGLYLIPRMTRDQIRSAITGPVAVGGASISPLLVNRLLNEMGDHSDQLPVLQHTLMRTWQCWEREGLPDTPVAVKHYEEAGTMHAALSLHAEEAFGALESDRERMICEKIFRSLTEKRPDMPGTRRPTILSELCAIAEADASEVIRVIEVFREPGRSFLVPPCPVPLHADSVIDISHESLMRVWQRLARWVEAEADSAEIYLNLLKAARLHEAGKQGLYRDPELAIALRWREQNRPNAAWGAKFNTHFAKAISFLDKSEKQELDRQEEKRKRQARRKRRTILVLAAVVVLLCSGSALITKLIHDRTREAEEQSRLHAQRLSIQIDVQRINSFKSLHMSEYSNDPSKLLRAADLALKAQQELDLLYNDLYDNEAGHFTDWINYMALDRIFYTAGPSVFRPDSLDRIHAFAPVPGQKRALCMAGNRLYDIRFRYPEPFTVKAIPFPTVLRTIVFNPGGSLMAGQAENGDVAVFSTSDFRETCRIPGMPGDSVGITLGTGDTILLARNREGRITTEVYASSDGRLLKRHTLPITQITSLCLQQNSIVCAAHDSVYLWTNAAENPSLLLRLDANLNAQKESLDIACVTAVALSPQLNWIAWGDSAGHVCLRKLEDGTENYRSRRSEHIRQVNSLLFLNDTDGSLLLASGGADGQAVVVNVTDGQYLSPKKHPMLMTSAVGKADYLSGSISSGMLFIQNDDAVYFHFIVLQDLLDEITAIREALRVKLKKRESL